MGKSKKTSGQPASPLLKCPTGIRGFDEIAGGGLPQGRPTLVCGAAGCGKTLLGTEFLVRGALQYDEPGVFIAFEETAEDLAKNVASLGFDLNDMIARKKMVVNHVHIERSEIQETGDYDLEGLFIRLGYAIDSIGAKRVVLDTIESLFSAFLNDAILRSELRRLFRWLKDKGVTAIVTGESGNGTLTRRGLEEYVADCVILLDQKVMDRIATRRVRVIKYRGSTHGTDEYPFLIDEDGISVLPITSLGLNHEVSAERISTGIERLDHMLGGKGYYRGSSILVSGVAGTGKTSIAAHFIDAACKRGERGVFFAFEESPDQIIRNMRSIGIDLGQWVKKGLLKFHADRPTHWGLEVHLARTHKLIDGFKPDVVVMDPISNLTSVGAVWQVSSMTTRLIDFLKANQISSLYTDLTSGGAAFEQTEVGVSSVMDTWLLVKNMEHNGERNRGIYVLKSRGMNHSNQIREFVITDKGVTLVDVYVGPGGVMTGSARAAQEARDKAEALVRKHDVERKQREIERKRKLFEGQIAALQVQMQAEEEDLLKIVEQEKLRENGVNQDRLDMARLRRAD